MEHTHTNKITYITIAVVGIIVIVFILNHLFKSSLEPAAPIDTRPLEEQMTATGPSTLKPEEEALLREQTTATTESVVSDEEMKELRESMRAQN